MIGDIITRQPTISNGLKAVHVLACQPSTGGGQTLSSYRIPIAWENLGIKMAEALAI